VGAQAKITYMMAIGNANFLRDRQRLPVGYLRVPRNHPFSSSIPLLAAAVGSFFLISFFIFFFKYFFTNKNMEVLF